MTLPHFADIVALPVLDNLDLLGPPVAAGVREWASLEPRVAESVGVIAIDPSLSDTEALVAHYGLPVSSAVNCVVVAGKREGVERVAAVCVRADTRADINTVVRGLLSVRKASFMSMDRAVEESGMEYGAITPVGVPPSWRILLDGGALGRGPAMIGAGSRAAKLVMPGELLATMPCVEVVEGLAR
jgi:prolyl-tRNA editing enzyme YbaK/EbsC (Cys-tRNA(Pro) deacylase)